MQGWLVFSVIYGQLNPNSSSALEGQRGLSRNHEEAEKGEDDMVRNTCWRQVRADHYGNYSLSHYKDSQKFKIEHTFLLILCLSLPLWENFNVIVNLSQLTDHFFKPQLGWLRLVYWARVQLDFDLHSIHNMKANLINLSDLLF